MPLLSSVARFFIYAGLCVCTIFRVIVVFVFIACFTKWATTGKVYLYYVCAGNRVSSGEIFLIFGLA